jgi:uncharacterized protein (TIGR03083 family)
VDYAVEFLQQNRAFGELIRSGESSAPIPTCPGWTLDQLMRHVGRGDRWAAQIVADRLDDFLDPRAVANGKPPADPDGAIAWLNDGAQLLIDAIDDVGVETPVWTFLGSRPAYWWARRRLHEATVHRADAALALAVDYSLTPELAADAISEWLERVAVVAGSGDAAPPLEDGQTIHLHADDPGLGAAGEWTIRADGGRVTWLHGHDKGAVALRGNAVDLLLAVVRRVAVADTGIAVFGDAAIWQNWLDRTPF